MFNSPKSYENILQKGELCLLNALTNLVLGKLMILTIKIAPECATFDTERGGTQSGLLFYASYCGGMLMLRFINYQNIVSVNFDHAQKFQNYAQMSETTANPETFEAVGGAGEKFWIGIYCLFCPMDKCLKHLNSRRDSPGAQNGH